MTPLELALSYAAQGWPVFPCDPASKKPLTPHGFKDASTNATPIRMWWRRWPTAMVGVPTGPVSGFWVLDRDTDDPIPGELPDTLRGRTPRGTHWLFRWDPERPVKNTARKVGPGLDTRGEGGYIIAAGSVREDGSSYEWEVSFDAGELLDAPDWLYELLAREPEPPPRPPSNLVSLDRARTGYALAALDDECKAVASCPIGAGKRNEVLNAAAFSLGTLVGAGALQESATMAALFDAAVANGYVSKRGESAVRKIIASGLDAGARRPRELPEKAAPAPIMLRASGASLPAASRRSEVPAEEAGEGLLATRFVLGDPSLLPPRSWLYGRHLIRRFVSGTVAPGGVGKSSLSIVEALAMATGRNLLDVPVREPLRVWYWNGEDPEDELERRFSAACLHFGITPDQIGDRLYVNGRSCEIVVVTEERGGLYVAQPVVDLLERTINVLGIDVCIFDPFVSLHEVNENDNTRVNRVVKTIAALAGRTNSAFELIHHVRKGRDGADVTVEDARGAVAFIAGVRSARALTPMAKDTAQELGVPEADRIHMFRADNGKANMSPPSSASAWFRRVSVDLGNETDDMPSDHVGVVTHWRAPSAFDGISLEDVRRVQEAVNAGSWRKDRQAVLWVGYTIIEALGWNRDDPEHVARATALLATWLKGGVLKTEAGLDEYRKPKPFVVVGNWLNPG